ncbi:unnamed protein product [Phytophthora fragariaefolia]|uniref:Unnamed protein product n=1 Tax=Phytophthora fragariaefolia TaxID=1490495 RepID=A0A9W6TSQ7_9STRA|nr:unnamed protein product [Phytophthora fragariaefolia]
MAAETEQQRAPELAAPEPESSPRVEPLASKPPEESKPAQLDVSRSGLAWPDAGLQPLRTKPTTPGGSSLKVETCPTVMQASSLGPGLEEPKPSDGLPVPSMSCDSVSPVSPTVMKDLQFDSRFISDAWSYEAPQNMYALLTQPTSQLDPLAGGAGMVTPYMQLQAQQQQHLHLQQQQQLEQQLEHGLPLQMSPIHGSGLSPLYMSGASMAMSPHQLMLHQPSNGVGVSTGYPTTPTAVSLSDIMVSGDPSMFLAPSGSPTSLVKQHMMPPMSHAGGAINVKDLTLNELRPHFNKPMAAVAKELGVCITLMKKICRRNGLVRWPHRRIRSLVNRITSLQVLAGNAAGAERKRFQGQIAGLREELSAVIQNPNEKSRKAQSDTKIPIKIDPIAVNDIKTEFPIAQIANDMVGPAEVSPDNDNDHGLKYNNGSNAAIDTVNTLTRGTTATKKTKPKKSKVKKDIAAGLGTNTDATGETQKINENSRMKKRKPSFGLHAHQPPPIKIPRHDELPSMSRLRSQSVPERRLRGDRRYTRGRDTNMGASSSCVRPSTTTHRNGRRGSISSILNDIPE